MPGREFWPMQCQNVPRPHLPRVGRSRTIIGHSELASRGPKPLRAGGDAIAPRPARSLQPVPRPRRTLYLFGAREPLQADPAAISAFSALRKLLNRAKGRKIQLARHGSCHSKCHSSRSGTRFYARKIVTTWSPLTESNRRPSPYHGDALPTELRGRAAGASSGCAAALWARPRW